MTDTWQQRIVGHDVIDPSDLLANPLNFRIHNDIQKAAIEGSLSELGWVKSVVVNQTTGHILDGHARVTLALKAGESVPVEYVELDAAEERLALASLDYIAEMAAVDRGKLDDLLQGVSTGNEALQGMLAGMAEDNGIILTSDDDWGTAFDGVPEGDRAPFQQMTFTLHDDQVAQVKEAGAISKSMGAFDSENENSNGNALARICETFITDHG